MSKMNEDLLLLLSNFLDEELTDEEIEEIETNLDKEQQEDFLEALKTLFDESDEFSSRVNKAVETLTKLIIALEAETEEEETEVEGGGEKVKKKKDWSFTFTPEED